MIIASCSTVVEAARRIGASEQTLYRWRAEYGGLRVDQARRLKQPETENNWLKRPVAELIPSPARRSQHISGHHFPPRCPCRWPATSPRRQ